LKFRAKGSEDVEGARVVVEEEMVDGVVVV
jgi:hypothetical protein